MSDVSPDGFIRDQRKSREGKEQRKSSFSGLWWSHCEGTSTCRQTLFTGKACKKFIKETHKIHQEDCFKDSVFSVGCTSFYFLSQTVKRGRVTTTFMKINSSYVLKGTPQTCHSQSARLKSQIFQSLQHLSTAHGFFAPFCLLLFCVCTSSRNNSTSPVSWPCRVPT